MRYATILGASVFACGAIVTTPTYANFQTATGKMELKDLQVSCGAGPGTATLGARGASSEKQ